MHIHIIIKENSFQECMEYILTKPINNCNKISVEKYWKDPELFSIEAELHNYKTLELDKFLEAFPKNFGRIGICKDEEYLEFVGTNKRYSSNNEIINCGEIVFLDISEIEIELMDRLPDEDAPLGNTQMAYMVI